MSLFKQAFTFTSVALESYRVHMEGSDKQPEVWRGTDKEPEGTP